MVGVPGHQDRGEEPAERGQDGQAGCILPHRQGRGERDQHGHDAQPDAGSDDRVVVDRRKGREIYDACPAALQRQGVLAARLPEAPSHRKQRDACGDRGAQAELDREPAPFGHVAQKEREAKEKEDDTHAHKRVAAEEHRAQRRRSRRPD